MVPETCGQCEQCKFYPSIQGMICDIGKAPVNKIDAPPYWCPLRKADEPEHAPSAFDVQIAGDHYRKLGEYQPWMVCSAWMTDDELRGAAKKDVIAYLARERDKGGIDDIRKALHTLQIFLELWDKRQGK